MHSRALFSQHQRLESLFDKAEHFSNEQMELRSHWARYLCVLSAGFIENALVDVYSTYARSCASRSIGNYVENSLRKVHSPKSSRFLQTARAFNSDWEASLKEFLDTDGRREAIDGIMSNRHLIAHGRETDITLGRVSGYLKKSVQVVDFIANQCGNA